MIQLKNERELSGIRDACKITAALFDELQARIHPGITTLQLDTFARDYIVKRGGRPAFYKYQEFPANICVSVNDEVIHGIPGSRVLLDGDIVGIDLGIELDGFFSDAAKTFAVGRVSKDADRLMHVTQECLRAGIDAAVYGNRIKDISRAVYDVAKKSGYGVVREYCGHGVGFSQHEDPQVSNYVGRGANPRLKPGMVIAIEPMINAGGDGIVLMNDDWTVKTEDGSLSAHFEHTIAIHRDNTEILTQSD
jgi:methionyl aminopeptidase